MTDDIQTIPYLRRSYAAVDGLWFLKVEEEYGFDAALDIDCRVWAIMAKLQARELRNIYGENNGIKALHTCFSAKLELDGFTFRTKSTEHGEVLFEIIDCPWFNTMIKSGRQHYACKIGERICATEYAVWAGEFNEDITADITARMCCGDNTCTVRFARSKPD